MQLEVDNFFFMEVRNQALDTDNYIYYFHLYDEGH